MNYPTHLQYSKSHEWIHTEDGVAVIGISDFAQHALGCPARAMRSPPVRPLATWSP